MVGADNKALIPISLIILLALVKDFCQPFTLVTATIEEPFVLHPGEFVLGTTFERVTLSNKVVARLEGKSSLGRIGLLIHSTAGFVDPGFAGYLTLELSNVANLPIKFIQN